jgi:hypothetical protein
LPYHLTSRLTTGKPISFSLYAAQLLISTPSQQILTVPTAPL